MSLDIQSELNSQVRAVDFPLEAGTAYAQMEGVLLALASGLAATVVSAIWVSLSLG